MRAIRRAGLWRKGPVTDAGAVVVAVAALIGAMRPAGVPVVIALAAGAGAVLRRRTLLIAGAVALLAAGLAQEAHEGLVPPPAGPFHGTAVLVDDPMAGFGGWRADVRTSIGRLELVASGAAGGRLGSRRAGERIAVTGRVEAVDDPTWTTPRHVRGRLVGDRVAPVDGGSVPARFVNGVRDLVLDGARSLPPGQRALFAGFVLGDDRDMPVEVADDFDGAGLAHLLVVSGQNVAFVLAVATPLVGRLRRRGRFVATLAVLVLFAAVTRFEPSVLRATGMAAVAGVAVVLGRPVAAVRVLALTVTALVLVDPLLVLSLGFRLSVAASAGIVVLARPLAGVLPGPAPFRTLLAVTLAAQVAVAPLLVPAFGPMPVAALPANVLAEPVAGLVMMWGCTAGLLAGIVPDGVATVLHLPTRLGLWWVAGVARWAAGASLGRVGLAVIVAVAVALGVAVALRGAGRRRLASFGAAAALVALLVVPHVGRDGIAPGRLEVGGAELWTGSGARPATVLVVPGDARADQVLAGVRASSRGSVDLVVLRSPGPRAAEVLRVLTARVAVATVWAPRGSPAAGAVEPPPGGAAAGGLRVVVRSDGDGLDVDVGAG